MCASIKVRLAATQDREAAAGLVSEAARRREQEGAPVWLESERTAEKIGAEVRARLFLLAELEGEAAGRVTAAVDPRVPCK